MGNGFFKLLIWLDDGLKTVSLGGENFERKINAKKQFLRQMATKRKETLNGIERKRNATKLCSPEGIPTAGRVVPVEIVRNEGVPKASEDIPGAATADWRSGRLHWFGRFVRTSVSNVKLGIKI